MSISPTQLTLKHMREQGYFCWITEYWHAFARQRKDLWGFCDVLCLGENEIIAVQCTSDSNMAARVKKIADHENTPFVRKAGIKIFVMGWKKDKDGNWKNRIIDCS